MIVINTGNPEGNLDYWVTSSRGDSRILWGWHKGAKIQSGGGGGDGKSYVPQHKWDDRKRPLHKCLDNSSLIL